MNDNLRYILDISKKIKYKKLILYFFIVINIYILLVLQPLLISKSISEKKFFYITLLLISLILDEILGFYNNHIIQKIRKYSKEIIWNYIQNKKYFEFINLNLGETQNLIQEGSFLVRFIFDIILKILKNIIMITIYSILLYNIYKLIGIVYLLFYIVYIYISYNFLKNDSKNISKSIDITSKINSFIVDYFINYNTIYSENSQKYENIKMNELLDEEEKKYYSIQFKIIKSNLYLRLFLIFSSFIVIVVGFDNKVNLEILLIIIYSIFNLNDFGKYILNFFECWDRLKLILEKIKIYNQKNCKENFKIRYLDSKDIIVLKNISYKYPTSSRFIIRNKSFAIKNGTKNLIIGKNGEGKSTICKIMANMLETLSGEVIYNGKYIDSKKDIIYYSQDINLFDRSIIENIIYPETEINNDKISKIKQMIIELELDNIIKNENELFYKKIGDFGKKISGGEKQKILIARALLSKKKVIIFDELNSGIDKKNNINFYNLIEKYLKNRTVIIISHREEKNRIINNIIRL